MLHCWNLNPESRPTFFALEDRLGKLLENGVVEVYSKLTLPHYYLVVPYVIIDSLQHYINLNQQYVEMNANNSKEGKTDYLALMKTPSEIAPSVPNYVDSLIDPNLKGFCCFHVS